MENRANDTKITRFYYCDPLQFGQKGTLENKHIELHYILPKHTDLNALGIPGQESLNLVLSNVNSSPMKSLEGRSSLELTRFMYPYLYEKLQSFVIKMIPKNQVILKPYLLKK